MVLFEEVVDRLHLLFRTAGEVGDEERNEVLLLAALSAELLEDLHEAVELLGGTLAHQFQHFGVQMFRRDLEVAGDVVGDDLPQQLRLAQRQIEPDAGVDVDMLDLRVVPDPPQHVNDLPPGADVGRTGHREEAARTFAPLAAVEIVPALVDVPRCAADVADRAAEEGFLRDFVDFAQNGVLTAAHHVPPLVGDQPAEGAPAGTAAHRLNRILDRLERRNSPLVFRMRQPGVGQFVDMVELLRRQRFRRRLDHQQPVAVTLIEAAAALEVHLRLHQFGGGHQRVLVREGLFEARQFQIGVTGVERLRRLLSEQPGGAADAVERGVFGEAAEHLRRGALPHAVDEDVRLRIDQHRGAELVLPVVVVDDPPHARLQPAEHDRNPGERLADQLGVDGERVRRPLAGLAVFGEAVVAAEAAAHRVDVDHRIHVAAGDATTDAGAPHHLERFRIAPVRLGDETDAVAAVDQQPPDDRDAEGGMVDVTVAGDQENVQLIEAGGEHLLAGCRQKFGLTDRFHCLACMIPSAGTVVGKGRLPRLTKGTCCSARSGGGKFAFKVRFSTFCRPTWRPSRTNSRV